MAIALSSNASMALRCLPSSHRHPLLAAHHRPTNRCFSRPTLAFSRRRNHNPAITSSSSKKNKKSVAEEEDLDDDPFEALFSQLEEDLENDDALNDDDDDDDDINEEDIDMLARELEELLGGDDIQMFDSPEDEEEEEEEIPVKLKNWQIRRLAHALKAGRRKTSIKNLAAEICLDRAVVLQLLRDPPPNLVMMSAALPDEPAPTALVAESETKHTKTVPIETTVDTVEPKTKVKEPVHVMRQRWSAQKRLKKVQVATLESVYRRSKRPTNTMISSIVHLTNLPRKRVIKWFEDKRAEDGVPDHRKPYQRSVTETVFS